MGILEAFFHGVAGGCDVIPTLRSAWRAFRRHDLDLFDPAVPDHRHRKRLPNPVGAEQAHQIIGAAHRILAKPKDDVAGTQARAVGEAAIEASKAASRQSCA